MRVLLDTCVLSELQRSNTNDGVHSAVKEIASTDLFVSTISIGEIVKGITLLTDGMRKKKLQNWIQALERHYTERILPIDLETTHIWGELTAMAQKKGRIIPVSDGLIASTAIRHGLHVMTRNIADFAATGAMLINPWRN